MKAFALIVLFACAAAASAAGGKGGKAGKGAADTTGAASVPASTTTHHGGGRLLYVDPRQAPPMDPKRKITEQDCTRPVDWTLGNLKCKQPVE